MRGFKFYRQDYYNDYLAYNPSNGYYGYIGENGAYIHDYGFPLAYISGTFPANATINRRSSSCRICSRWTTTMPTAAPPGESPSVSVSGCIYTLDDYRPTSRERDHVDDDSIKLTWVDKTSAWLTFRANYTFLLQTGSIYNTDVYDYAFLAAVPGFAAAYPNFVVPPTEP